jgi:hypothetical protein
MDSKVSIVTADFVTEPKLLPDDGAEQTDTAAAPQAILENVSKP